MASKEILPVSVYRVGSDDKISPYKISVLVFISQYCTTRLRHIDAERTSGAPKVKPLKPSQCKSFCLLALELIQCYEVAWEELESIFDPDLYDLDPGIVEMFIENLKDVQKNGVNGLLNLAQNLENLLIEPAKGKPMIRRDSVLGVFIRKMVLQLDNMSFEATMELSNNLKTYLDKTKAVEDPLESAKVSRKQAELIVCTQLNMLQRNENLAHNAIALRKILERILHENKEFSEANYLAHLNELRSRDFGMAEKKLHIAYDQKNVLTERQGSLKIEDTLMNNKSFRYAALNLAFLYANFGHREQALAALNECVALSGEAADHVSLQETLAWFCKLEEDPCLRQKMLERLISKSSELNLYHLVSLGLQLWTQDCALSGIEPTKVFEYLHASDVSNCQHALTDMVLSSLTLWAAIWNFYGYPLNALQASQLLLTLHTGDPTKGNVYFNNEYIHVGICNIGLHLGRAGKYSDAESVTKHAAAQYSHFQQHSHLWKLTELHVAFYRALWLAQWDRADSITDHLAVFDGKDSLCKKAYLYLCKGDISNTRITLNALDEELCRVRSTTTRIHNSGWEMAKNLTLQVHALVLRSALFCSQRYYTEALEFVSRALDICKKHHMMLLKSLVFLQLAEIQLHMNMATNGLQLVNEHLNTIYTNGSLFEQGLATFLKARCLLAEATADVKGLQSQNRVADTNKVFILLNQAKKIFNQIEAFYYVKDVLYLEAALCHESKNEKERNTKSMLFRQLDEQYPVKSFLSCFVFIGL